VTIEISTIFVDDFVYCFSLLFLILTLITTSIAATQLFTNEISYSDVVIVAFVQARSQHFYKGGHKDGGTEGPERGVEARSAEGVGSVEGRHSPSPVWRSGGVAPENFRKINVEIAHFPLVLQFYY